MTRATNAATVYVLESFITKTRNRISAILYFKKPINKWVAAEGRNTGSLRRRRWTEVLGLPLGSHRLLSITTGSYSGFLNTIGHYSSRDYQKGVDWPL